MGTFRMPSLGADMEDGTLVEWLKQPGDRVGVGDIIAVVETQKGAIEIEVFEGGVLDSQLVAIGQTVPVGTPLALIRAEGEPAPAAPPSPSSIPATAPPRPVETALTAASPPPARPAAAPAVEPPAAAVPKTVPEPGLRVSPAARRLAAEYSIDLTTIHGSGPDGAIVFVDVEEALRQRSRKPSPVAAPPPGAKAATVRAGGMEAMRRAIAAAMEHSKREIPHYYVTHSADVTRAFDALTVFNASRAPQDRVLFGAVLLSSVARAVGRFAEFNGLWRDGRFEPITRVHVGMAIALRGGGLVAPAIHDADRLSLGELMTAMHDLANRVRAGRFRSSEIADPTITLTSLGERGADSVLGVIYPPQVAIIGAGTPALRPWVVDGAIAARRICHLTLAADHRVSDGHRGSLFLAEIARLTENPELP